MLVEGTAQQAREAAARHPAAADISARLAARLAEAEAERDLLTGQITKLEDALIKHTLGDARPRSQTIVVDDSFAHPAFYGAERLGLDRPFRWLGRQAEARIATILASRSPVRVDITVEIAITPAALREFRILLDESEPDEFEIYPLDSGKALVSAFFAPHHQASWLARRQLRLVAGHRVDLAEHGDPRTLSVGIGRIHLEELSEGVGSAEHTPPEAGRHVLAAPAAEGRDFIHEIHLARLTHPAFHGEEQRVDGLSFRWMGRRETAEFLVRIPTGRRICVSVHVAMAIAPEALADFSIGIEGRFATHHATREEAIGGSIKSALFVAAGEDEAPRTVRLALRARRRMCPAPISDPRLLSVAVHAITIEADGGPPGAAEVTEIPLAPPAFHAVLEAEHDLAVAAFHELERWEDGDFFRWMGREERAEFSLPLPRGGTVHVSADIPIAIGERAVEGLLATLDGAPAEDVAVERREDGGYVKTFVFRAMAAGEGASALALSVAHRTDFTAHGDPRLLSVGLFRIRVDAF